MLCMRSQRKICVCAVPLSLCCWSQACSCKAIMPTEPGIGRCNETKHFTACICMSSVLLLTMPSAHAGLVLLEVSVVVFLLQGYITSGREVRRSLLKAIPCCSAGDASWSAMHLLLLHLQGC